MLLDASPVPSKQTADSLSVIYQDRIPDSVAKEYRAGAIVTQGSKLHLSRYFGEWRTVDASPTDQHSLFAH